MNDVANTIYFLIVKAYGHTNSSEEFATEAKATEAMDAEIKANAEAEEAGSHEAFVAAEAFTYSVVAWKA